MKLGGQALTLRFASSLASSLIAVACSGAQPPPVQPSTTVTTAAQAPASTSDAGSGAVQCDLVCEGAKVVKHEIQPGETADEFTEHAVNRANEVLNAMHADLLACYTSRVKTAPKAHAFMTIGIVVGPSGAVQSIATTGGALLGDAAMKCIVDRIKGGQFEPPHGGGTMHLEVPFTLRRLAPDESI